jgi:hypothetical protein
LRFHGTFHKDIHRWMFPFRIPRNAAGKPARCRLRQRIWRWKADESLLLLHENQIKSTGKKKTGAF